MDFKGKLNGCFNEITEWKHTIVVYCNTIAQQVVHYYHQYQSESKHNFDGD